MDMPFEFRLTKKLLVLQVVGIAFWIINLFIYIPDLLQSNYIPSIIFIVLGIAFLLFHIHVIHSGIIKKERPNTIRMI